MKIFSNNKKMKHSTTILTILLAVSIIANILLIFQDASPMRIFESSVKAHPYLDPAHDFYKGSDLIINMRPLREDLQRIALGKKVTIYFEYLNTGANISINDVPFLPGSLMKIPVAMAAMKRVDVGMWSLSDKLTLTDQDKNPAWGDMYMLPSGTAFTIEELLQRMLVNSDNTARAIFVRSLGDDEIENVIKYLGLDDVFNQNFQITAKRYTNFFRALYSSSYLSADSSETLLRIMNLHHDVKLLRWGIPDQVDFSHKIGVSDSIHTDSGIVYVPGRPYILTVMVDDNNMQAVQSMMEGISSAVYDYVTKDSHYYGL